MRTPIATLLERAANALPPQCPSRSSWAPFYPVVKTLLGTGHNVMSAIDWLIGQKEIKLAERLKAYRAILAVHNRHEAQLAKSHEAKA